jgi:SAM-dependent methyltransferase
MDFIKSNLKGTTADKILDVGTEKGCFLLSVTKNLASFTEAIGIDINNEKLGEARKKFKGRPVTFLNVDASAMPFSNFEFDMVMMNAVLHHLRDISAVLDESMRVLKPGGRLILMEPYRDNQNEKQQVSIASHHWFAKVDRLQGFSHNSTLLRQEIVDFANGCGLSHLGMADFICDCDWTTNGLLEKEVEEINDYLGKLGDDPRHTDLREEGNSIIRRLVEIGSSCASQLELVGIK